MFFFFYTATIIASSGTLLWIELNTEKEINDKNVKIDL